MTIEQIETFLSVTTTGSISAASDELFITQSNVSKRLASLEEELGVQLIIRAKGYRNISLTEYGKKFVPIASNLISLLNEAINLKNNEDIMELHIASIDVVNRYTLVGLYNQIVNNYPNIKLYINTHHSNEIHTLVEQGSSDVGFVFSQINNPFIIAKPIYRELMYLVCRKDSPYYENMDTNLLDINQEVYLRWGYDFAQWHNRHWSEAQHPLITVNTGSNIANYLNKPLRWGIAPMSVVQSIINNEDLTYYRLKDGPPSRICYMITHRYLKPAQQKSLSIFEPVLNEFINTNKDICKFEPWMLDD